jgi:hypothetical protein
VGYAGPAIQVAATIAKPTFVGYAGPAIEIAATIAKPTFVGYTPTSSVFRMRERAGAFLTD